LGLATLRNDRGAEKWNFFLNFRTRFENQKQ